MLTSGLWRVAVSLVLAALLFIATLPVSAADRPTTPLGAVSSVGDVALRGIPAKREGTFFSGDQIRTGSNSYTKLTFKNANVVEFLNDSSGVITNAKDTLRVGLQTGRLAFAAKKPVAIGLGNYEVIPDAGTTGGVAMVGPELAGIRVIKGRVTVRNLKNHQSATVGEGDIQVVNLKTDEMNLPPDQLVRALPPKSLPAPAALPRQDGGECRGNWLQCHKVEAVAIFGGVAAAALVAVTIPSPSKLK